MGTHFNETKETIVTSHNCLGVRCRLRHWEGGPQIYWHASDCSDNITEPENSYNLDNFDDFDGFEEFDNLQNSDRLDNYNCF